MPDRPMTVVPVEPGFAEIRSGREGGKVTEVPQRVKLAGGHFVPEFPDECEPHTDSPRGHLQWDEWAERMDRTHVQRQCKGCGLYAIWEPRGDVAVPGSETAATG